MAKIIGYTGNCGHWLHTDISPEACAPFYYKQRIPLPGGGYAEIIGLGEKCPDCFPESTEDEKVLYYRKDNTNCIRFLEDHELLVLKIALNAKRI